MSVLAGSLEVFALPELFVLLSRSRVSGALQLNRDSGDASVFFRDGQVYDAASSLSRDFIGQRLVDAKLITQGQLLRILDEQKRSGRSRVGDLVIKKGMLSPDQLEEFIRQQIQDTIFDVLQWDAGNFSFERGETSSQDVGLEMSVENLLMESSRRIDEWEVIRRRIPSPQTVPKMSPTTPEGAERITIHPDEWPLLVLADGTRTVTDIAAATGKSEFDASRILYGFVSTGLLDIAASSSEQLTGTPDPIRGPEPPSRVPTAAPPAASPPVAETTPAPDRLQAETPRRDRVRSAPDPSVTAELLGKLKTGVEAL